MPTHETRIAARDPSGMEVYFQHSTLPTKENVEAYEAFYHGAAEKMLDMAAACLLSAIGAIAAGGRKQ